MGNNQFLQDKVLVCEDDISLKENIKTILELEGFQVYLASNGKEAIKLLKSKRVNLIITDWMMPEMSGIELLQYIKSNLTFAHIPVVLLTAKNEQNDKYEALMGKAEDFITKPFDFKELLLKCKNHVDSRKQLLSNYVLIEDNNETYKPKDQKFIKEVRKIINENLSNEKLELANFTEHFHMSNSSFQKNTKRIFGKSIFDLVIETRLSKAKEILECDAMSIADVVLECGFKNHNFFSKKFRDKFGILPSKIGTKISIIE